MDLNNYKIYCNQLQDALIEFPNLSIIEREGVKILKGIVDVPNDQLEIAGSYLVEIHFTAGFPFRFPHLFEIGGAIENHIDWHKFSNNRCCITVLPDEILKCKTGITVIEFIKKYCFSFLANHIYRKLNGNYLNGEYSHGTKGILEFYHDFFKSHDTSIWVQYFTHVFKTTIFLTKRNEKCFCGGLKKFKQCHKLIFDNMWDIGEIQIVNDFKSLSL
ncbi:MAG: SEC-C domain-containing protein [Ferruginibacter sp.]